MKQTVAFLGDTLLNDEPLGIQRHAYELLKELDQMELDFCCELVIPADQECSIHLKNIKIVRYGSGLKGFLWRQICFPAYVRKKKALSVDLTLGLVPSACDIVCVYDCIYEEFPEDFIGPKAKLKRASNRLRTRLVTKKAKQLITVSGYSKKQIEKFYHRSDTKIIYSSWQHFDRIVADESILKTLCLAPGQYCFSLGSILPHKNIKWLLAAAEQNPQFRFVITGTDRLSAYQRELDGHKIDNVLFTGFLSDGQIKALMQNCMVFLHPSLYEGFGIPPMEAMSCGVPVALADATCLPEIYQDDACYFDPLEYQNIRMEDIMSRTVHASHVLDEYSWRSSAQKLKAVIMEACEE